MTKWPLVNISKDNTSWVAVDNVFTEQELDEIIIQGNKVKKTSTNVAHGTI